MIWWLVIIGNCGNHNVTSVQFTDHRLVRPSFNSSLLLIHLLLYQPDIFPPFSWDEARLLIHSTRDQAATRVVMIQLPVAGSISRTVFPVSGSTATEKVKHAQVSSWRALSIERVFYDTDEERGSSSATNRSQRELCNRVGRAESHMHHILIHVVPSR